MVCFQKLFLETTNPDTNYDRLLNYDVGISIFFHTISYLVLVFLFSYIFNIKLSSKTYIKLSIALLFIMILGYIGRLSRTKSLRNALIGLGLNKNNADFKSMELIRNAYYTYYFLG
jgi:hypothetical protein